ncbi:hypothetical protein B484DRAFT_310553, partial [Ochromonadaceae sp. CCMP2298]
LRIKLPIAPAALARVFSSTSRSEVASGCTLPARAGYSSREWKAALPIAKLANLRVLGSASA